VGQLAGSDMTRPLAAVFVPDLLDAELEPAQPSIYDTPIGLRELFIDPDSGEEHYLVRYPQGMTAARHHHSVAHTIIVLDGVLSANGHLLGPGSYCHFPAGTSMRHEPADGNHCRFVTIFHGPFDVFPEEDEDRQAIDRPLPGS
jgi:quercetin dioxygenase-like cupin family protein